MPRALFASITVIPLMARSANAPKGNENPAEPTAPGAPAAAAQTAPTYAISGTVSGIKENETVSMKLGGAATDDTVTNNSGMYTFAGRAEGLYAVMPVMAGYVFSPAARRRRFSEETFPR